MKRRETMSAGGALRDMNYLAPGGTTEPQLVTGFRRANAAERFPGGHWTFKVVGPPPPRRALRAP
jgi:hypothetical protein